MSLFKSLQQEMRERDIERNKSPGDIEKENLAKQERKINLIKWIKRASIPIVLATAAIISIPYMKTAYKKHKANNLIQATSSELRNLRGKICEARSLADENAYILVEGEEKEMPYREIKDSSEKADNIEKILNENQQLFSSKRYDEVRKNLSPELVNLAKSEESDLQGIIGYCSEKKGVRAEVVQNEAYLIARLNKPCTPEKMAEDEDLKLLSDELLKMVPDSGLEEKLKSLGKTELYNSLGANLVKHQETLNHILAKGKSQRVKDNTQKMYDGAFKAYSQVRELNDKLVWYRGKQLDGKWATDEYKRLIQEQRAPISLIQTGDHLLSQLDNYSQELHDQYYTYVSGHDKESTIFSHEEIESYVDFDSEGDMDIKFRTVTKHYPGWKFFYTLTTVIPGGETRQQMYVGEKEGDNVQWDYAGNEQVGILKEWKKLHDDNQGKVCGRFNELKPFIEKEE